MNLTQKILHSHLVIGDLKEGSSIGLNIDEVYTQDATGTMAWLQFEAIGIERVKVPLAVSYVDHNMIQSNFMNPDDHQFLQSSAARFGAWFSRPGNGICHQVNLERFAKPGNIVLGTDSHTPTNGGMGMIAFGVGGLDAATVMAGSPFEITMPKIIGVKLIGALQKPWLTAMDVILELLRRLTVKGGVGKIFEYFGDGVKTLNVPQRATITNMGAELGATTSIFPSDEITFSFLKAQGREGDFKVFKADNDAKYDEIIEIDLSSLTPMIAKPHSPDAVVKIKDIEGQKVDQVCIGSCTNSSYQAMKSVAAILKGRQVHKDVNLHINPGSKQVAEMLARDGSLAEMIAAGARIMEVSCGPCIGMGSSPATGQTSIRTFNRNFKGRSGNNDAFVYLTNPLAACVMAITGHIIDPRDSEINLEIIEEPDTFLINDNMLIPPPENFRDIKIIKGPNIKEVPVKSPASDVISAPILLKLGDNITTDDIMPAGSKVLPYRSNIPEISKFVFTNIDETFYERAIKTREKGGGIIVGGENYGQGSSREHAAIAPMYLGIQAVIVKSFARIHRTNLINFGILPLIFSVPSIYEKIMQGDRLEMKDLLKNIDSSRILKVDNETSNYSFDCILNLNQRERAILLKGGLLSYSRG
ncbi:MAG: aconitate hydratase [Nitrospirae bacterium]|nr:aconitate hydratase [Nitrospirota bacterium]MBF0540982.1 aconitate hydratase [Nitrospirota bacterium]